MNFLRIWVETFLDKHRDLGLALGIVLMIWFLLVISLLAPFLCIAWMARECNDSHRGNIGWYLVLILATAFFLDLYVHKFVDASLFVTDVLHRFFDTSRQNVTLGSAVFSLFLAPPLTAFISTLDFRHTDEHKDDSTDL